VVWDVTGAITLGANSVAIGDMRAFGAITLGASASSGTLQSTSGGAVTLGAGTSVSASASKIPDDAICIMQCKKGVG
jgi:hypothetical protein